jgi:hypothetical protein
MLPQHLPDPSSDSEYQTFADAHGAHLSGGKIPEWTNWPSRQQSPQGLSAKSGAAFGATLYRDLILFGATECDVDNESISFILPLLFGSVRDGATRCIRVENRT